MTEWTDPRGSTPATSQARSRLGGVVIAPKAIHDGRTDPGLTWAALGLALHDRGWAVIPQTVGGEGRQRQPGGSLEWTAKGEAWKMISYKTDHRMHLQMPPRELVARWTKESHVKRSNSRLNVAAVPGESAGSFGWFVIDIDIFDAALMKKIVEAADRILGRTEFLRGRAKAPKAALFYRRKLGALRIKKNFVLEEKWDGESQQIEIKDDGSPITIYGYNPSGDPYRWLRGAEPFTTSPEHMPEVDEEQILEFLAFVHSLSAIQKFAEFQREARSTPILYADTDISDLRVPRMFDDNAQLGQTDGRRGWLLNRSKSWVRFNAGIAVPYAGGERIVSPDGVAKITAAIIQESEPYLDWSITTGKTLTLHNRHRVVADMVRNDAQKVARGDQGFSPIGTRRLDPVTLVAEPDCGQGVTQIDAEYSWLPKPKDRKRIGSDEHPTYRRTPPNAEAATAVALVLERTEIEQRVAAEIRAAIFAWLDALWTHRQAVLAGEKPDRVPAHLLKAPTGAGKTTMLLKCLGQWKLDHPGCNIGPILMLMPSYANIGEIAGRGDLGIWVKEEEERADDIKAEAEGAGIEAMIYRGKIAAGCLEAERVKALQEAGINSGGLCEAEVLQEVEYNGIKGVEKITQFCRYHPDNPDRDEDTPACEAILQRLKIPSADIVLAPHAFLTTNAPKALKDGIVAVVVDEKVWDKAIGTRVFPIRTFLGLREEPTMTKAEKADNKKAIAEGRLRDVIDPLDRWQARNEIAELIHATALAREDLATAVVKAGKRDALKDALWVTGRLQRVVMEITPDTSIESITDYTKSAKTKYLPDEHKVLSFVAERADMIAGAPLVPVGHPLLGQARGATDARIQLVDDGESLRVSWRKKLNFDEKPFLFLDASGSQQILERIWGRDIIVHDIQAPLHVRCVWIPDGSYAKSRILPSKEDSQDARMAKSSRQVLLREAMTAAAIVHGDGAVVAASALEVRKHIQRDWHQPGNLHFMHFGATRGLDFAKKHAAAFSVGQLELPPRELDAITGALTSDLPEPEKPCDPFGNGRVGPLETDDKIERRLVDRDVPLRDGGVATVQVYEPEGDWAKVIVEQIREEELSQFLGRLRPVYRTGRAPTWYHAGRVLPRRVFVDEVIALEDLARPFGRTSPVLHEMSVGGVLTPTTLGGSHLSGVSNTAIAKAHAVISGSERWQRGLFELEYTVEGSSEPLRAFVPGFAINPLGALKSAVYDVASARIVREPRVAKFGLPQPDKVDAEIGTIDERAAGYVSAMDSLMTRVVREALVYDDRRSGIQIAGRAQAPHLVAAYELMTARIVEMQAAATAAEIDMLPPEVFMLTDLTPETIAGTLAHFDDAKFEAILERAGVIARLDEIRAARRKLAPVEISFGAASAPAPANSEIALPELPEGVVRFKPKPWGFRPVPVVTAGSAASRS